MAYRTFIGANINGYKVYFDFDICTERSVQSNAVIPQYPVESGVAISDHMYRNPRTMTLSGTFSLNRASVNNYYSLSNNIQNLAGMSVDEKGELQKWLETTASELKVTDTLDRLTAIQTVFEWIQANGILCDIYMADTEDKSSTRFKTRKNMALQNISWRENYNSMQYTFTFTEVINISALSSFETYPYNSDYPDVNLPASRSLGEVLVDTGGLVDLVLQTLVERGYISKADAKALVLNGNAAKAGELQSFVQAVMNVMSSQRVAGLIGLAAGAIGGAVLAGLAVKTGIIAAASGPVGWVILGAALLGGAIAGTVTAVNQINAEARLAAGFNLIKNYRQYVDSSTLEPTGNKSEGTLNMTDISRLRLLLDDMAAGINEVFTNISFYQLSTSEKPLVNCVMPMQVGSDILEVTITPSENDGSETKPYQLSITRGTGTAATNVTPLFGRWPAVSSLYEMKTNGNMVYRDTSRQYQMYLMNPAIAYATDDTLKDAYEKGSNYYLVVCRGNIEDSVQKLNAKIVEVLSNQGYTV